MSDKQKIGLLATLVCAMAAWWWLGGRAPGQSSGRSFRHELLAVDTARLTEFTLVPRSGGPGGPIHFRRDSLGWVATEGDHATRAFQRPLNTLLEALSHMQPLAMPGSGHAVMERYALTDSLAARFRSPQVLNGAELRVGSTTQGPSSPTLEAPPVATAVMLEGDSNVYLVPGTFSDVIRMNFLDWIPKPMANGNPANWDRLTFTFPGNVAYSLERVGDQWWVNGMQADQERVEKYLGALSRYYGNGLADPNDTLHAVLVYQLRVDDRSLGVPVHVGIFQVGDRLIARSTLAPRWLVVPFDPATELPRMFRPPEAFLPQEAPPLGP